MELIKNDAFVKKKKMQHISVKIFEILQKNINFLASCNISIMIMMGFIKHFLQSRQSRNWEWQKEKKREKMN